MTIIISCSSKGDCKDQMKQDLFTVQCLIWFPGSLNEIRLLMIFVSLQVKTRVAGRVHTLTVRDVTLSEAGEVKLTAKEFHTLAQLIVRGQKLKHTRDSKRIT